MTDSEPDKRAHEHQPIDFLDKLKELLPGVEFEETTEIFEARMAVLEMLKRDDQDPKLQKLIWAEYASIWEQTVDAKIIVDAKGPQRAEAQIAAIVRKALIFREVGNRQRYFEELTDAEEYAFNSYLDEIAETLGRELDNFIKA